MQLLQLIQLVILIILINVFIGAGVFTILDTKDKVFYEWYKKDPTCGFISFLVLLFWPVLAFFIIKYRLSDPKNK